ncbi:MAG: tyrosine-type recombinase/integrase [Candidatus Aenigmarchaeota archaeon]|nr:tyrosine-type recombinase/integrase [Candidatus Aenigmarchaeota archaeon]
MAEFASVPMKDPRGYISEEQVEKLIDATDNLRDRLMLQIMYRCGRRVSEVLLLSRDDILWEDKKIIFSILKRKKPIKELKPVDNDTLQLLKTYCEGKSELKGLKKKTDGLRLFPVSRQYVFKLIRKLGAKTGIVMVGKKMLHPHHLRHSFAVHQVKNNIKTAEDLRKLQMYMGHSNIATTAHYLQFSPEELRDVVNVWNRQKQSKKLSEFK